MQKKLTQVREIYLRFCLLVCTLLSSAMVFAQDDDDDMGIGVNMPDLDMDFDSDGESLIPSFGFSEIVLLVVIVVVAYMLSKLWKGCSVIFLLLVALVYILSIYLY